MCRIRPDGALSGGEARGRRRRRSGSSGEFVTFRSRGAASWSRYERPTRGHAPPRRAVTRVPVGRGGATVHRLYTRPSRREAELAEWAKCHLVELKAPAGAPREAAAPPPGQGALLAGLCVPERPLRFPRAVVSLGKNSYILLIEVLQVEQVLNNVVIKI